MCEEGRRREEGKINEDEKDPGVVAIRTWLSTLFKRKVEGKMVWKDEDTPPSPHFHDICAEIRDWRDEIYHYEIQFSSLLGTVLPFETISSILETELTFA